MTNYNDTFKSLTGGGADSLDGIAVETLSDLDAAYGMVNGLYHPYTYDASSVEAEASPYVIIPNDNVSGTGAWILGGFRGAISHVSAYQTSAQTLGAAGVSTLTFDVEDYDDLSEFNHATGIFAPISSGRYLVTSLVTTESIAWLAGEGSFLSTYIDDVQDQLGPRFLYPSNYTNRHWPTIAMTVNLLSTENLRLKFNNPRASTTDTAGARTGVWLKIDRLI